MIRLATDEDFSGRIFRGVLRRQPLLDIVRVQDRGLAAAHDATVLTWAADEGRVLLSHDATTMRDQAYGRLARSEPMPGLFIVSQSLPVGVAIEEILTLAMCSEAGEWEGQVRFLPL